jgi:hypothetical protein
MMCDKKHVKQRDTGPTARLADGRKLCAKAEIEGLRLHDLRDSAVTRLVSRAMLSAWSAHLGSAATGRCRSAQIARVLQFSVARGVAAREILDRHRVHRETVHH